MKQWVIAAGTRALKTFAQAAVTLIFLTAIGSISSEYPLPSEINWLVVLGGSAIQALVSLLTSIAGIPEVENGESAFKIALSDEPQLKELETELEKSKQKIEQLKKENESWAEKYATTYAELLKERDLLAKLTPDSNENTPAKSETNVTLETNVSEPELQPYTLQPQPWPQQPITPDPETIAKELDAHIAEMQKLEREKQQ